MGGIGRARDLFTIGEVAYICEVSRATVSRWFDLSLLRGFRIPGSRHRRVPAQWLREFMIKYGMPLERLEREMRTRTCLPK